MSAASSNKRIAKNTAFLYARMLVVMVVTFYTSRVILQVLGASDYGVYSVVGGIVTIMQFLNGALSASTSRFLTFELGKGDKIQLKNTFAASLNLHICVALLVLLMGETIGLWFLYEKLIIPDGRMTAAFWVLQFSIVTTMVSFTQVPYNASLIAHENMSIYAYVGLYEAFSKLAIVYLIAISQIDRLIFYAFLIMLNTVLIQLFYRIYTKNKYEECRFSLVKDRTLYKKILSYSGWDLFGGLAVVCQSQGINIVLNLFFGPIVNAARAIATQVQTAVKMFTTNFLTAARPQVVKSYAEGDKEGMFELTLSSAKYAYIMMLALILPICFEIDFILKIWLGDNIPDNSSVFIILIMITCLVEAFHSASLMAYHAIGKIKLGNIVGGTLMIMALPISYFVLKMGAPAYSAFIVIFVVNSLQMLWGWIIIHRYETYSYNRLFKEVFLPSIIITLLSLVAPTIIHYYIYEGWLRLIILLLTTETVIAIASYYIALDKKTRTKLMAIIKKRLHHDNK